MSLEKLENNPDFAKMQEEILEFWEKDKTFEKSVNKNRKKEGEQFFKEKLKKYFPSNEIKYIV